MKSIMKTTLLTTIIILSMLTALMQIAPVKAEPDTITVGTWTEYSENPIFGGEATFPGYDTSDQCVIKIIDTYYMYYTSVNDEDQYGIYYATSPDGLIWNEQEEIGGLVNNYRLIPGYCDDPDGPNYWKCLSWPRDPWVLYDGATYHLYYIAAMNWVRHATSNDGVAWTDQGLITIDTYDVTFGGPMTAYYDAGTYYAWFISNAGNLFRIVSEDGHDWDTVSTADSGRGDAHSGGNYWKNFGPAYGLTVTGYTDGGDNHQFTRAFVLKEGDNDYHMWFGGDKLRPHSSTWDKDIGYAVSEDGIEWTMANWFFSIDDGIDWRSDKIYSPQVIEEDGLYKMWFSGRDESENYATGYSTIPSPLPDYYKIKEAINAADTGDTVLVNPGTYILTSIEPSEFPGIDINRDDLTLKSVGATEDTIIDFSLCHIAIRIIDVNKATVEGFTMKGGSSGHQAFQVIGLQTNPVSNVNILNNVITGTTDSAINIYGAWGTGSGVTVSGNIIDNCQYGIMAGAGVSDIMISNNKITNSIQETSDWGAIAFFGEFSGITITGNEIFNNEKLNGIFLGSGPYDDIVIENNIISNNLGGVKIASGPGISNLAINYNNIMNNEEYGVLNLISTTVDATLNWWGTVDPGKVFDMIVGDVEFTPYLDGPGGDEFKVTSEKLDGPGKTEPTDTDVGYDYDTTGEGTDIIVAQYDEKPEEAGFTNDAGKYYDVYVENPSVVTSLTLKFYYTTSDLGGKEESTLRMRWYDIDTSAWLPCSPQTVHTVSDKTEYSGYIEVIVTTTSTPTLDQLKGTAFGFEGELPEVADERCDLSVSGDVIVEAAEDATIVYASMGDTAEITVEMDLAGYHGDIYFTLYKKMDKGLAYIDEIRTVYGIELKGSRTADWVVDQNPGNYVVWINIDLREKVQLTGLDEALHIGPIEVTII